MSALTGPDVIINGFLILGVFVLCLFLLGVIGALVWACALIRRLRPRQRPGAGCAPCDESEDVDLVLGVNSACVCTRPCPALGCQGWLRPRAPSGG